MIESQPKLKNPETNKVDADYHFGDIKFQRKYLLDFANAINSQRSTEDPKIDGAALVQTMLNRVSRYYGMQTKYNGNGSLKEGY